MTRIFVSYAHEDTPRVEALVARLREQQLHVSWDQDIPVGQVFRQALRAEIGEADWVIVAWTQSSIASHWVQGEADLAAERQKLVPLRFEAVELPLPFGAIQCCDFIDWDGSADAECFLELVDALRKPAAKRSDTDAPVTTNWGRHPPARGRAGMGRALLRANFGAIAIALLTALYFWPPSAPAPVVVELQGSAGNTALTALTTPPAVGDTGDAVDVLAPGAAASGPAGGPAVAPTPRPSGAHAPGRVCCHSTGSRQICNKARCSECGWVECSK